MRKLLVVSIASPPKSGAESLQTGNYIRGLSTHFSIELVTTKVSNYGWTKATGTVEDDLKPYLSSLIELNSYSNRYYSKLKSFLPQKFKFPDSNFHFHLEKNAVLKRLKQQPDAIYSRSTPFSSAMLAYKLKEKLKIPWIMHLSDPWSDNPYAEHNQTKNLYWEKNCIEEADLVTVTNENYLKFLKNKYPVQENKFALSYNTYNPIDIEPLDFNKPFTFTYIGSFYGDRTPEALLKPLKSLYDQAPDTFNNVSVLLIGNLDLHSEKILKNYNLPFVHTKGSVPNDQLQKVANETTAFINIEDRFSGQPEVLFLPSKVMDYISLDRLILSISAEASPSVKIINGKHGRVFKHEDSDRIEQFIKETIQAYFDKNSAYFSVPSPDPTYGSNYQAEELSARIKELMESNS